MLTPTRGPDAAPPASTAAPAAAAQPVPSTLAQGNADAIQAAGQAAAAAAPANVAPADAQATFASRASELIATGMSPGAAVAAAAQAVAQLGAASTRDGPATPAQALGDSLAAGGGSSGSPALAAALASGQSPAQAMATAAAAARQEQSMQAAANVPIGQGASNATAMGGGGLPANIPNPAAFASALASGMSPEAALARSAAAAQTLNAMRERATLPETPARQAASGIATGDLASLPGVAGNATGAAALAAALARGISPQDALAAAARAMATREDQERRGTVPISERDACAAAMAGGAASGGCDGVDDARTRQQMQTAAVPANPDATALAEGRVPDGDADPEVTGRLLQRAADPDALVRQLTNWAAAVERQERAARVKPGGDKSVLMELLAQGRATPDDIAEIVRRARSGTLAGITKWLLNPAPDAAAPQTDRQTGRGASAVDGG